MLMMHGEMGRIGGMGTMLAISLTKLLQKIQQGGISSHLHLCYVLRGQIIIKTNDHRQDGPWSTWNIGPETDPVEEANFKMPEIATSYHEFICRTPVHAASECRTMSTNRLTVHVLSGHHWFRPRKDGRRSRQTFALSN